MHLPPFTRGSRLLASLLLPSLLGLVSHALQAASAPLEPIAPIQAPFAMPQLARPEFPARELNIRDFGAVEGGQRKNTEAIEKAIQACAEAGGGHVIVPKGRWLTGPIHLRSRIDLHLEDGAELLFSDVMEDYLPVVFVRSGGIEAYNYSPLIYAKDCTDIAITGHGLLNGNGRAWWEMAKRETKQLFESGAKGVPVEKRVFGTREAAIRPSFLGLVSCKNVLLEGFTIGSGPNWTIHPIYCENVIIRRVNVDTDGPNNDGIDPDSCRNVLVEWCTFNTGDDCLVLKSGYNEDGWRVGRPCENVIMRHCSSKHGHGGLVIGSEMSGDVRNVYMHDCQFEGTDRAVRIKSKRGRGGIIENVWAERVSVKNMQYEAVILNMDYGSDRNKASNEKAPLFRNIHIKDLDCDGAPRAIQITGLEDSPIENISFENLHIRSQKGAFVTHARGVTMKNVQITPASGAAVILEDAAQVSIQGSKASQGVESFLKVSGAASKDIVLEGCELSGARETVQRAREVPAEAVSLR